MASLFGFTITRQGKEPEEERKSIVPKDSGDGSVEIAPGGVYGTYIDIEGKIKNDGELVSRYRDMSVQSECDMAIQDIINEAIIMSEDGDIVELDLDKIDYDESIKEKIRNEFNYLLKLLDFNNKGYDIFKKWYVDGRMFYHIIVDESHPRKGIKELRYVDPRRIKKMREDIKEKDPKTGATIYKGVNEYYLYNQKGMYNQNTVQGVKIAVDSICYTHSGLLDGKSKLIYSHLHKAIKPLNQLRMLEDSVVIYRLVRAPERRIFYIDTGNLPKIKAEQYVRDMMTKHKNKVVYDAQTGEVRDDRRFMTMLEDFWLPRREGGRGTEITTLPGGQNLGDMEDVEYFRRKLYKALNVPITRMETENAFNLGRGSEITRDEIKFSKFIDRLRRQFSTMFDNLLEIQLSLKGVVNRAEWKNIRQEIAYNWQEDNHYNELKETEILTERLRLAAEADQFVGKYVSSSWIMKNVFRFSDDDVEQIEKEIKENDDDFEDEEENGFAPGEEQPATTAAPAGGPPQSTQIKTGPDGSVEVATTPPNPSQGDPKKQHGGPPAPPDAPPPQEPIKQKKKAPSTQKEEIDIELERNLVESVTKFLDKALDE